MSDDENHLCHQLLSITIADWNDDSPSAAMLRDRRICMISRKASPYKHRGKQTTRDITLSGIMWPVPTVLLYIYVYSTWLYSAGLESDDLTSLSDSTSEKVLDDLTSQHGLFHNAFNMLRANSAIPDTLAS